MMEMSQAHVRGADPGDHISTAMMSLALDGFLDGEELHAFHDHLQGCQECRDGWLVWQQLGEMLQVEPLLGPAPGFAARVDQRVADYGRRRERLLGGLVLVGGTALIWSLLVLGAALTSSVWFAANPGAQVRALEFLGYLGQFVAVVVGNLTALRDNMLGGVPVMTALVLFSMALLATAWLWIALVSPGRAEAVGVNGTVANLGREKE
jgi:predicted anti-sigma-YlaC factor YlaD